MRKHLYLITEHRDEERVGLFQITDTRVENGKKNEERTFHTFDEDAEEFLHHKKTVGLGYHDFEDEEDYEERISEVLQQKLGEIDADWLKKAGHDPAEYKEGVTA